MLIIALNVNAQEFTQEEAKEIELLKLKTGDLIDSAEISPEVIAYSYAGAEVENGSKILFKENLSFSNLEIIDDTHLKVYFNNNYYRDQNNFVREIQFATTTKEIWNKASVETLPEKISKFFIKTVYADISTTTTSGNCTLYKTDPDHSYSTDSSTGIDSYHGPTYQSTGLWTITLPILTGTITQADFILWKLTACPESNIASLYKIARTDVVATQSSWNHYNTAGHWTTAGAKGAGTDFINTVIDTVNLNSAINNWDTLGIMGTNADNSLTVNWGDFLAFKLEATVQYDTGGGYYASELNTNASIRPYIKLTYTPPAPPATATTTPLNCIMPANYDISVITGCHIVYSATTSTSTMATSSITIDYYYLPFLLYLFVLSLLVVSLYIISLIL